MENSDASVKNPLRVIGLETKEEEGLQSMGLVMARAGLGKTAILVQFALDCMMNGRNVLHVAIGEDLEKTRSWYDDIVSLLKVDPTDINELMSKRMIMTFQEGEFSQAVLAERIADLEKEGIFTPDCLVIDGYNFAGAYRANIQALRVFAENIGIKMMWFSATCHREDERSSVDGVPAPCHGVGELFETVLQIDPEGEKIELKIVKCETCAVNPGTILTLDPSTLLLHEEASK